MDFEGVYAPATTSGFGGFGQTATPGATASAAQQYGSFNEISFVETLETKILYNLFLRIVGTYNDCTSNIVCISLHFLCTVHTR